VRCCPDPFHSKDEAEVGEALAFCDECGGYHPEPDWVARPDGYERIEFFCPVVTTHQLGVVRRDVRGEAETQRLKGRAANPSRLTPPSGPSCGDAQPNTPERPEEQERVTADWRDLPPGVYEGANRYSTDDEEVLTIWRDGKTWDVRVDREVERIKDEAAERLREAFYTDGLLSQFRRTAGEGFREAFDVVFQDAMILTEPGKAEQVPSSTHPKARGMKDEAGEQERVTVELAYDQADEVLRLYPSARLQAAERERERLRIELQEAHRSLSKLTNDPDFHEDIREKWSSIAFWRSKAEAAEARATQLEAEFGHLRDQPIIYGSEAKKAAEAEDPARSCPECRGTRFLAGDFEPCRNPFHDRPVSRFLPGGHISPTSDEDAKHDDENWMRDLRAECARANRAEARATRLEAEFGHLRGKPIIYGSEAKKAAAAEAHIESVAQELNRITKTGSIVFAHSIAREAAQRLRDNPSPPEGEKELEWRDEVWEKNPRVQHPIPPPEGQG
jgi:hypothetical protein